MAGVETPPLVPVSRAQPLPLSLFQEETWNASRTAAGATRHVLSSIYRIVGPLDRALLAQCLDTVHGRYECLRTTFTLRDGQPVQVIHPHESVPLPFHDFAGEPDAENAALRVVAEERKRPIDLARGPLMRWCLLRLRAREHWLLRVAHHIILDAWSTETILRELVLLYEDRHAGKPASLPDVEPLQYADYAVWQRKTMHRGTATYEQELAWWKAAMAGTPLVLELPFERPRELASAERSDGVLRWGLDPAVSRRLDALGAAEGVSEDDVRLAGFVALLAATAGQRNVLLGGYVINRHRAGMQAMFGFLANFVLMRFSYRPDVSFRRWLAVVKRSVAETAQHGDIPIRRLRSDLLRKGVLPRAAGAIFGVSRHRAALEFAGLTLTWFERQYEGLPTAFSVTLDRHSEADNCEAVFDARVYDPQGVRAFLELYRKFLGHASERPDLPMRDVMRECGVNVRKTSRWLPVARAAIRRLRRRFAPGRRSAQSAPSSSGV